MIRLLPAILLAVLAAAAPAAPARKAPPRPAAAHDWTRTIAQTPDGGVRMGNPAAKVAVVEYGSRTCPHCAHFEAEGLPALKAKYIASGAVSYEFRDFPVHDALDLAPILIGRCGGVRLFYPLLDAMMTGQDALIGRKGQIPADEQQRLAKATPNAVAAYLARFYGYRDLAVQHGLAPARADACLADKSALQAIVTRADAAQRTWHVASTPTFLVNGKAADGVADWAGLEPVLRAAGA